VEQLFYPKSVVVIGVSERPDNLARNIVENLFEFQFNGEIFLVGRREGILFGRRILTSMDDLPEGIDVAVILTPALTVPGIIESCGKKGVRWAIIETGGFREYSKEGAQLENEILQIARKWGIRIVGPNGIGIMNVHNGFIVPFVKLKGRPISKGKVSILAQSGGVLLTYANLLTSANVGLSKIVSMGNKIDLNEIDYLNYLVEDPQTEIIGLYLESLERGRELMEIARSTSKSIIVHKANTGEGSRHIARLHTAALANDDRIVEAGLRQADIIRTKDFRSFVNAVKILFLPPIKGKNLVIISRSGGIGVVAADSAERHGFRLFMHGATGEEKEPSRRFIQAVKDLSVQYQKPIALQYNTDEEELAYIKRAFDYPIFAEPEDTLTALAISRDHYRKLNISKEKPPTFSVNRNRVMNIFQKAKREKRESLLLHEAFGILEAYGIPVADYQILHRKGEIEKAMDQIGPPVALKVVSTDISHKSDAGGVILHLQTTREIEEAYDRVKKITPGDLSGVLIQKMVSGGREVILGGKRDPSFGPVVLFGLGGIYVEVLQETSLRIVPINRFEAEEMISELKSTALLKGIRGERPSDRDSLIENLLRLSQLITDFPEIEGIDINPLIVLEKGAIAVDARILLKSP